MNLGHSSDICGIGDKPLGTGQKGQVTLFNDVYNWGNL